MIKIEQTGGKLTEEEILHGKNDAYAIYQINWKGKGREYAFLSFDSLRAKEKIPNRKDYQLVYSGVLEPEENLDSLYMKFNITHPDDFTGHSLSISDIVVLQRNGRVSISYVDMIGFVRLPDFYKEPQSQLLKEITESTKGFIAEGHFGTWHAIQMQEFHNEKFFQMRHDEFGEQVADIIVNEQGQVIAEDLWNGFSPEAVKLIGEYLLDKSLYEKKEAAYRLFEDKGYFFIQETEEGYDYTFYDQEYQELDGGVYDNLDVSLIEAAEDILNEAGEVIENIVTIDYEELLEEVEEANERQMQRVQLEKNCPATIFEDFDRKKALESYEGIAVQFTKSNGFLAIQATEEGYSYILYDSDLNEVHSSDYNNPDLSIQDATYEILKGENMENMECVKVDYEEFEKMTIQHEKDLLQKGEIHETSEIGRKEGALNGLSRSEVERGVLYHAQAALEDVDPEKKVELIAARVTGSRSRQYLYRSGSDIDVVLSYKGEIREDSFFNVLHASRIMMAGIIVDINPIAEERITLAEYMSEAEKYLDQQEIKKLATDLDNFAYEYDTYEYQDTIEDREGQVEKISEDILTGKTDDIKEWLTEIAEESDIDSDVIEARSLSFRLEEIERLSIFDKQPEATISFYVAECMEFPSMGEYHNNLTLEEAIKIYESIPAERLHGIKGIGFDLQDGDEDYSGEYALMSADRIDYELIDMIPHYKESPLVQKAIADMEKYLSEKHIKQLEEHFGKKERIVLKKQGKKEVSPRL